MILIDREDVIRIGLEKHPAFQIVWEIGSPEAVAADYADVLAPGPFLLAVNDEDAWAGQDGHDLHHIAQKRADIINLRQWRALADMYAESIGISRQAFILRFAAMRRRLRSEPDWVLWKRVYHWPEGSDLVWSSLQHRHEIKTRENAGIREAGIFR